MEDLLQDINTMTLTNNNVEIREVTHLGRRNIVVPVIMMVEGVHNGSRGSLLHTAAEFGRFPASWNGIPVTIQHPANSEGQNISANSPEVIESSVGRIYHTKVQDNKLKAEVYIDVEKITQLSPVALAYIRQGRPLDVSVGVFTDEEETTGEYNGEQYSAIAKNHRPDHLALLPGGQGACSWNDGCGIRVNSKGGNDVNELMQSLKELNQKGYSVSPINNSQGFREVMDLIRTHLNTLDNDTQMAFLQEVYEEYYVYEVSKRDGGNTLYKQVYNLKEGKLEVNGTPVEVRKKIEYETLSMKRTKKEVNTMAEKSISPCCLAKVEKLIAHKATQFTAEDTEWLLTQDEKVLDKLFPVEAEAPQVNKEDVISAYKATLTKVEDFVALMPETLKATVEAGLKLYTDNRTATIQSILDNSKEVWVKEDLEVMTDAVLQKIAKSVTPTDYSLSGGEAGESGKVKGGTLLPLGVK